MGNHQPCDSTGEPLGSLPASALLEASNEACLVARERDRRIVWANAAAEDLFARQATELRGRSLCWVHPTNDQTACRRALETDGRVERTADGSPLVIECGDGRRRPVVVRTTSVDHGGKQFVVRWFEDSGDGSDDASESTAQNVQPTLFRKTQQLADVGAWLYDVQAETLWWSTYVFELFDQSPDAQPDLETALAGFHPADRERVREALEAAIDHGEPYDIEVRIDTDSDEPSWVRARAEPHRTDGSVTQVYGTIRDVTERKARERARERDRERLEVLFDESPNVIIVHDVDGNVIDVNDKHVENLGYDREELLSMHVSEFEVGAPRDVLERVWRGMDVGGHRKVMGAHRRKDGSTFPTEVWLSKIEIDGEKRILAVSRDVTEREERERSLEQFRQAIEAAGHAIFLTDRDGTIEYVNPAFEEITGYSAEEAIGETPAILNSGRMDERYYQEQWETILAGEQWEEHIVNSRKSGETYHAHQTIAPITKDGDGDSGGASTGSGDSSVLGFVSIQTDVTERIQQEQQLNTLDRVLRHNLRNELNVVNGHAEIIRASCSDEIRSHANAILESMTELLETAQKGRKVTTVLLEPDRKKPIDVVPIVERTATAVDEAEPDADVTVDAPSRAVATATDRIGEAVAELVENAIRHTDRERPSVTVSIDVGEVVRIRVADDGPGIPEMERDILDEVRSEDDLHHGSGLGLWFVYWVVRKSGGRLEFEENEPRGSVVTVELGRARSSD